MKKIILVFLISGCSAGRAGGGIIESIGTGIQQIGTGVFQGVGTVVAGSGRAISDASGQRESVAKGMPDARERRVSRW